MPPKYLNSSSIWRTVPSWERVAADSGAVSLASLAKDHLLALAEQPLRAERHQPDQEQPGDRQPQRRDPGLGERRVGQLDEPGALDHEPEEDRADEDALVVGKAGEDEHAEGEEGDQRLEVERVKGGEVDRQEE